MQNCQLKAHKLLCRIIKGDLTTKWESDQSINHEKVENQVCGGRSHALQNIQITSDCGDEFHKEQVDLESSIARRIAWQRNCHEPPWY